MRSFSSFEKSVLTFMKGWWDKDGYSTVKKALESTIEDFKLELSNIQASYLYTTAIPITGQEGNSSDDPNQIKLAKKLGDILAIINLIKSLVADNLLLLDKDLRQIPKPMIIGNIKSEHELRKMSLFGEYLDFFHDYYYSRLFPAQDLIDFIDSGFKSKDDIEKDITELRYNKQYSVSRFAVWISLIVGISSIILNIVSLAISRDNDASAFLRECRIMCHNSTSSISAQDSAISGQE